MDLAQAAFPGYRQPYLLPMDLPDALGCPQLLPSLRYPKDGLKTGGAPCTTVFPHPIGNHQPSPFPVTDSDFIPPPLFFLAFFSPSFQAANLPLLIPLRFSGLLRE